jgi:hypothetical protein
VVATAVWLPQQPSMCILQQQEDDGKQLRRRSMLLQRKPSTMRRPWEPVSRLCKQTTTPTMEQSPPRCVERKNECAWRILQKDATTLQNVPVLQEWVCGESRSTKRCKPKPPYEIVGVHGTPKSTIAQSAESIVRADNE